MSRVDELQHQVLAIIAQLSVIDKTLNRIAISFSIGTSLSSLPHSAIESYADVLSKNVADTIKLATDENIKLHKKTEIHNSSLAVYSFPEYGCDLADLYEMLRFLGYTGDIICHERIGRTGDNNTSSQPIKVVLRSTSDQELILSRSNMLSRENYYAGVYISRWLSQDELKELKSLRQRFAELNNVCHADKKGRKPYVVIPGQLMKHGTNGKLTVARSIITDGPISGNSKMHPHESGHTSSSEASQSSEVKQQSSTYLLHSAGSKNGANGSHIAPAGLPQTQ